ncbi:HNH endonuclease signature motif containing protein [Streptomyces sp. PsTaAH-124]|uniref:HNH endonuclease n=1 Tax=Streptomyces sp. PsTaAH-124 TaxID=1157638 RepID=UPI0009972C64
MPRAASVCYVRGCTKRTTYRGRCPDHAPPAWETTSARNREKGPERRSWDRVVRPRALARDCFACVLCGVREGLEVDHVLPIAKGGSWSLDNAQTLCRNCHREKTQNDRHGR